MYIQIGILGRYNTIFFFFDHKMVLFGSAGFVSALHFLID